MRFVGEGAKKLRKLVGQDVLSGHLRVDQVYAKYQHERMDLKHPRGGQAKYLWLALVTNQESFMNRLAKSVLETGPAEGMKKVVEEQDRALHRFAPVDRSNLRNSGNPRVFDDGRKVYDRAARQPRMSAAQLKARHRGGSGGLGDIT